MSRTRISHYQSQLEASLGARSDGQGPTICQSSTEYFRHPQGTRVLTPRNIQSFRIVTNTIIGSSAPGSTYPFLPFRPTRLCNHDPLLHCSSRPRRFLHSRLLLLLQLLYTPPWFRKTNKLAVRARLSPMGYHITRVHRRTYVSFIGEI